MILIGRILQSDNNIMKASTLAQQATSATRTYLVSIPFFGYTDGQAKEYKVEATAAAFPGMIFDYKENDIVYLSFFQNDIDGAIILGKVLHNNLDGIAKVTIQADEIKADKITLTKELAQTSTNKTRASAQLTTLIDGQSVKTTSVEANEIKTNSLVINTDNGEEIDVASVLSRLNMTVSGFSASLSGVLQSKQNEQTKN